MTTRSTATQEEDRLVEVAAGELTPLMIDWLTARLEGIQVEFDGIHIRHCPAVSYTHLTLPTTPYV